MSMVEQLTAGLIYRYRIDASDAHSNWTVRVIYKYNNYWSFGKENWKELLFPFLLYGVSHFSGNPINFLASIKALELLGTLTFCYLMWSWENLEFWSWICYVTELGTSSPFDSEPIGFILSIQLTLTGCVQGIKIELIFSYLQHKKYPISVIKIDVEWEPRRRFERICSRKWFWVNLLLKISAWILAILNAKTKFLRASLRFSREEHSIFFNSPRNMAPKKQYINFGNFFSAPFNLFYLLVDHFRMVSIYRSSSSF